MLEAAGYNKSEVEVRDASCMVLELRKLGYMFKWLETAGFTDDDFIKAGFIKSVYGLGWIKAKNPNNICYTTSKESTWQ